MGNKVPKNKSKDELNKIITDLLKSDRDKKDNNVVNILGKENDFMAKFQIKKSEIKRIIDNKNNVFIDFTSNLAERVLSFNNRKHNNLNLYLGILTSNKLEEEVYEGHWNGNFENENLSNFNQILSTFKILFNNNDENLSKKIEILNINNNLNAIHNNFSIDSTNINLNLNASNAHKKLTDNCINNETNITLKNIDKVLPDNANAEITTPRKNIVVKERNFEDISLKEYLNLETEKLKQDRNNRGEDESLGKTAVNKAAHTMNNFHTRNSKQLEAEDFEKLYSNLNNNKNSLKKNSLFNTYNNSNLKNSLKHQKNQKNSQNFTKIINLKNNNSQKKLFSRSAYSNILCKTKPAKEKSMPLSKSQSDLKSLSHTHSNFAKKNKKSKFVANEYALTENTVSVLSSSRYNLANSSKTKGVKKRSFTPNPSFRKAPIACIKIDLRKILTDDSPVLDIDKNINMNKSYSEIIPKDATSNTESETNSMTYDVDNLIILKQKRYKNINN